MMFASSAGAAGTIAPAADKAHTAVLITDPQNDFLREDGMLYKLLADNLKELNTISNIEKLMKAAKASGLTLAVDPLVYTQGPQAVVAAGDETTAAPRADLVSSSPITVYITRHLPEGPGDANLSS